MNSYRHKQFNNKNPSTGYCLDLSVMITEALTRFSSSRILYPTLFPLPDIPTSTKSKINNQLVTKCSIPPNMHFVSHVNLFTKGMDVLSDDRLIRKQYIGLFPTNTLNTFYGNSNIPPTHPPKPANQRILQAHSQQLSPLARNTCNALKKSSSWNLSSDTSLIAATVYANRTSVNHHTQR